MESKMDDPLLRWYRLGFDKPPHVAEVQAQGVEGINS